MDHGDIVVGSKPSTRKPSAVKPKTAIVEKLAKRAGVSMQRAKAAPGIADRHCGAMSQQRSDSGAVSTPQKFVHLVGCRDSKTNPPKGR